MKKQKITRTSVVHLRLSQPEADSLKRLTRHLGMTQSALVRWLITREAGRIDGGEHNGQSK